MKLKQESVTLALLLAVSACSETGESGDLSGADDEGTEAAASGGTESQDHGGAGGVGAGDPQASGGASAGGEAPASGGAASGGDSSGSGGDDGNGTGGVASEDPACDAARYCEDFESYDDGAVPGAPWSLTTDGGATLAADSTRPYFGSRALHVVMNQSTERESAFLEQSNSAAVPVPGGDLFGRMMVYRAAGPSPEHHFWVLDASGGGTNLRLGGLTPGNGSDLRHYLGQEPSHSVARSDAATVWELEAPEWVCVEWQFDTNANETRVWLDGEPVPALTRTDWEIGAIDTLRLGQIMNWAPAADQEMWFDQFAIDEKRIPCPAVP